jgi:hypothetical protein
MKHAPISPGHQPQNNTLRPKQSFCGPQKRESFFRNTGFIQQKAAPAGAGQPAAATGKTGNVQAAMSKAFGTDFSSVQIHENSSSAAAMGALAYTRGNDIHFAPGRLNTETSEGQQLIGHEFTHVLQQRAGLVNSGVQAKGLMINKDTQLEEAADRNGDRLAAGTQPLTTDIGTAATGAGAGKSNDIVQGYFARKDDAGTPFRVADDMSVATKDNDPWHELYAEPGKAAASTTALAAAGSGIELTETAEEKEFNVGGNVTRKLKRVAPKNTVNGTEDATMSLYADCGRANSVVVGGLNREAVYTDNAGLPAVAAGEPEMMKYQIMVNYFGSKIANSSTVLATMSNYISELNKSKEAIKPYESDIQAAAANLEPLMKKVESTRNAWNAFEKKYNAASEADRKKMQPEGTKLANAANAAIDAYNAELKKFWNKLAGMKDAASGKTVKELYEKLQKDQQAYSDLDQTIMKPYASLKAADRDKFDQKAGINKYAKPSVGEGYTISSGGAPASSDTWNYHWGGVVMESNDQKDKVVLENYSVSDYNKENGNWDLQMYGTQKKGQTFHEHHQATKQHGKMPITMEIKKQ